MSIEFDPKRGSIAKQFMEQALDRLASARVRRTGDEASAELLSEVRFFNGLYTVASTLGTPRRVGAVTVDFGDGPIEVDPADVAALGEELTLAAERATGQIHRTSPHSGE